jgi:DNA-binding Xre family transcriptional regulator
VAISWRLKTFLAQRKGILTPTELQKQIVKKTGVLISLQSLCNYLNKKPKEVRLKTVELICTALDCEFKDFCSITPSENLLRQEHSEVKKLSWQTTPLSKRSQDAFPDPKLYES